MKIFYYFVVVVFVRNIFVLIIRYILVTKLGNNYMVILFVSVIIGIFLIQSNQLKHYQLSNYYY